MKMKYERPVMKAELYQVNSFVAACGENQSFSDMISGVLKLKDIAGWLVPGAGNSQDKANQAQSNAWTSAYGELEFSDTSRTPMESESADGALQYYWSTVDTKTNTKYYLEYSVGRTEANGNFDTFILYKENTHNNTLNINWNGYLGVDWDDTYIPVIHPYDDSLAGLYFKTKVIAKS